LLGKAAAIVFAIGLLLAGVASSVTAGMAGGSIFAGCLAKLIISGQAQQNGVGITLIGAPLLSFYRDPFKGLLISQILLSMQLPFTIYFSCALQEAKK